MFCTKWWVTLYAHSQMVRNKKGQLLKTSKLHVLCQWRPHAHLDVANDKHLSVVVHGEPGTTTIPCCRNCRNCWNCQTAVRLLSDCRMYVRQRPTAYAPSAARVLSDCCRTTVGPLSDCRTVGLSELSDCCRRIAVGSCCRTVGPELRPQGTGARCERDREQ